MENPKQQTINVEPLFMKIGIQAMAIDNLAQRVRELEQMNQALEAEAKSPDKNKKESV